MELFHATHNRLPGFSGPYWVPNRDVLQLPQRWGSAFSYCVWRLPRILAAIEADRPKKPHG